MMVLKTGLGFCSAIRDEYGITMNAASSHFKKSAQNEANIWRQIELRELQTT